MTKQVVVVGPPIKRKN